MKYECVYNRCREIGHSPHGECGLKCDLQGYRGRGFRHSPHGECGLKSTWGMNPN